MLFLIEFLLSLVAYTGTKLCKDWNFIVDSFCLFLFLTAYVVDLSGNGYDSSKISVEELPWTSNMVVVTSFRATRLIKVFGLISSLKPMI